MSMYKKRPLIVKKVAVGNCHICRSAANQVVNGVLLCPSHAQGAITKAKQHR